MYIGTELLFPYLVERSGVDEEFIAYLQFVGFMACVAWSMAAAEALTPFLVDQSDNAAVYNLGLPIVFAYAASIFGYICILTFKMIMSPQVFHILF